MQKQAISFVIVALSLFFSTLTFASAAVEISDGTVTGLFHFNGDVVDSSGKGHNFTDVNTADLTTGVLDHARDMTSLLGYLTSDSSTWIGTADFSIGYWMNPQEALGSGNYQIWKNAPAQPQEGISYSIGCTANHQETLHDSACKNDFAQTYTNGTWYHLLWERCGSVSNFYVNGALANTAADISTSNQNDLVHVNGEVSLTGRKRFYIDELFFTSSCISTTTRDAIYNGGLGNEICTVADCAGGSAPTGTVNLSTAAFAMNWLLVIMLIAVLYYGEKRVKKYNADKKEIP